MHVTLLLPQLPPGPLPALELLVARGRAAATEARGYEDWLAESFELAPLPAGALTAGAAGDWLRADPVHLQLLRDRVVVYPVANLRPEEAAALVATLNRHFEGRHAFRAPHPDRWAMSVAPGSAPLEAPPPSAIAGADLERVLPPAPWPALLNEIQMGLHEHPVNEAREMPVNGLWLWGAGSLPAALGSPWRSVTAIDPLALGLARAAGARHGAPPASAQAWLDAMPEDGRHLVVLEGDALEERWFAPLVAALKAGRLGMLSVHAPASTIAVEATRSDLRRFWRRPRALSAHAHR